MPKISVLPTATTLTGNELLPMVQGGVTVKSLLSSVSAYVLSQTSGGSTPTGPAGGDLTGTYPNPTIGSGKVTGAKVAAATIANSNLAVMNNNTVKGNVSGGAAVPVDLTATQLTALINAFTTGLSGAVPASGGGTTNFLRADGTFAVPVSSGIATIALQAFTANGTYTPTASMKYCIAFATGGGGGGASEGSPGRGGGGGGGGGGTAIGVFSAATIGVSQAVTIGAGGAGSNSGGSAATAGGNTTLGALLTGSGGGVGPANVNNAAGQAGGTGGAASSGVLNVPGGSGNSGTTYDGTTGSTGGQGGGSFWGGGGTAGSTAATAIAATVYGSGGGGASTSSGAVAAGGAGLAGVVFVIEFI